MIWTWMLVGWAWVTTIAAYCCLTKAQSANERAERLARELIEARRVILEMGDNYERAVLRAIEAENPGIDIERVAFERAQRGVSS